MRFFCKGLALAFLALLASVTPGGEAQPCAILIVKNAQGVVSVPVDFAALAQACGLPGPVLAVAQPAAVLEAGGKLAPLLCQFDPLPGRPNAGTLSVLMPPDATAQRVRVYFTPARPELIQPQGENVRIQNENGRLTVANRYYTVAHDPAKMAGLPSRIEIKGANAVLDKFTFNDRVHDPKLGSFPLAADPKPTVELLARGPLVARVRVQARYMQKDTRPSSRPEADYVFTYVAGSPLVRVEGFARQREPFAWNELHFIEMDFHAGTFTNWATGNPWRTGVLKADKTSCSGGQWAALTNGKSVLGILSGERAIVYDGEGGYMYLHGPWVQWRETERAFSTQLWLGSAAGAEQGLRLVEAAAGQAAEPEITLMVPSLEKRLEEARKLIAALPRGERRGRFAWALAQLDRKIRGGALAEANTSAAALLRALEEDRDAKDAVPWFGAHRGGLSLADNGHIGLGFEAQSGGLNVVSLFDLQSECELLAATSTPLWRLELRGPAAASAALDAAHGWGEAVVSSAGSQKAALRWRAPTDARFAGIEVKATIVLKGSRATWRLEVENESKTWGLWRVCFPQVALGRIGPSELDDRFVYPFVSGQLVEAPLTKPLSYQGLYPECAATMQFFAHYDNDCGLYLAAHDPLAGTKELHAAHTPGTPALICSFNVPAENMGAPGNGFRTSGTVVMETFRGDWFDAAQLYKRWVGDEAKWRPEERSRTDTPQWMRDLPLWAQTGGDIPNVVKNVKAFAEFMGVPAGLHWYTWHQIPFDNSYPHYLPAKPGFAAGVRELQAAGVRVMPYINGRLWDSGLDDFKDHAIAAATKDENGVCYIEEYGSGRKLAPMCPVTPLWQRTVKDIVLRLFGEEGGVDAVYIDQVAAAAPRLCFDKTHGHPLGGGHWWTVDGYWKMLGDLRSGVRKRFPGRVLTTECNAEPYVRFFDGYLTWNFQYQDQIPLFAAVYGGKLQMFGRAYRGGATQDLALRMKAAQSLVFGEQIGWMEPTVIKEPVGGPFIRRVARLRYALRDYFSNGDMARVPTVAGDIPKVTADWQWSGAWPVTTDALFRGAWRAKDGRLALIFVNVLDKELSAELVFDGARYDLAPGARLTVTPRTEDGAGQPAQEAPSFRRRITLPAYQALVLEIHT